MNNLAIDIEEALLQQLVRLIALCEHHGLDLEVLFNEARCRYDGDQD